MKNVIIKVRENEDRKVIFKFPHTNLDLQIDLNHLKNGVINVTWEPKEIMKAMDGVIRKDKIPIWLTTPNKELNNCTPLQKIMEGEKGMKEVKELLNNIEWGIPT